MIHISTQYTNTQNSENTDRLFLSSACGISDNAGLVVNDKQGLSLSLYLSSSY